MQDGAGSVAEAAGGALDPGPAPAGGPDVAHPALLHAGDIDNTAAEFKVAWAQTGPVAGSVALLAGVAAEFAWPSAKPVRGRRRPRSPLACLFAAASLGAWPERC